MSTTVSEEGFVIDFKKWENIKFSIGKKPSDYTSKIRPFFTVQRINK